MNRSSSFLWLVLVLIVLLPTTAGRFLLDLAGGLMLLFLTLPLILGGIGWIGWRILKSKMKACDNCGTATFSEGSNCPICGSKLSTDKSVGNNQPNSSSSVPASAATIDVTAKDIGKDNNELPQ